MPAPPSPSWAEVRVLPRANFPHASVIPDWLLLIDKLTGGLFFNRDGILVPVSPVAPVVVADAVGVAVATGAALDLRQNRAQLHLGNSDSVDGAYVLGLDNQAWFSAGVHFDGASWRADQTGVGMVFGMFLGALNFYTSSPVAVGAVAPLTGRAVLTADGRIMAQAGAATIFRVARLALANRHTDGGSVLAAETDLDTRSVAANVLATDGDSLTGVYGGTLAAHATATRRVRAYFAASLIYDSGDLTTAVVADWALDVTVVRVSATVARCLVRASGPPGMAGTCRYTEVTGTDMAATQILKVTGQASGAGAATDAVICRVATLDWRTAA